MTGRWSGWSRLVVPFAMAGASLVASCDHVADPTPPGTAVLAWDRTQAKAFVLGKHPSAFPGHPVADAPVVEGPVRARYRITSQPVVGEQVAFDLEVEAARVRVEEDGRRRERWTPIRVAAALVANRAYRVWGECEPALGALKPVGGDPSDLALECHVRARRPTQWGETDGLDGSARIVIEGKGRLVTNQIDVASVESLPP